MDVQSDHGKFLGTPAASVKKLTVHFFFNKNTKENEPLMHFQNYSLGKNSEFFDSNFQKLALKLQNYYLIRCVLVLHVNMFDPLMQVSLQEPVELAC